MKQLNHLNSTRFINKPHVESLWFTFHFHSICTNHLLEISISADTTLCRANGAPISSATLNIRIYGGNSRKETVNGSCLWWFIKGSIYWTFDAIWFRFIGVSVPNLIITTIWFSFTCGTKWLVRVIVSCSFQYFIKLKYVHLLHIYFLCKFRTYEIRSVQLCTTCIR